MANVLKTPEKIAADAVGRRHHMIGPRFVLLLLVAVALALVISWRLMMTGTAPIGPMWLFTTSGHRTVSIRGFGTN